jgi:adenylate cyclase
MGTEIERKFLIKNGNWRGLGTAVELKQGYLSSHPDRIVRVRVEGNEAKLTIKGRASGATRGEWEYAIPLQDANHLLVALCERPLIEKRRHRIPYGGMLWEVDEFFGDNAGLVLAEIELESEEQKFHKPDWIGEEVTHDPRYFNSNLLRHPYNCWRE